MSQTITENPIIENNDVVPEYGAKQVTYAKNQERSLGLKFTDGLIYPLVNNFGVLAISVGFTFLTKHGNDVGEYFREVREATDNPVIAGASYGAEKFSEFWAWRGEQTVNWLRTNFNMDKDSAEMAKMVAFSFLDGCLLSPAVKLLEDRRGDIARSIDKIFNTTPEDESIYDAEPKQSWGSVLGGRALTAAIVVPTAVAMDNLYLKSKDGSFINFNNFFLNNPGFALAEKFEEYFPKVAQKIGTEVKPPINESRLQTLGKTGAFEIFYTGVCTAGLYFSSRFLASHFGDKQEDIIPANNIKPFKRNSSSSLSSEELTNPETLILANNKLKLEKLFEANELSYQR
jgi:hypothetical protein